ncbi:MAG: FtsX-like permease family protein [Opitutaceae bacterium]|jgi:putative ABC transport system permease protein
MKFLPLVFKSIMRNRRRTVLMAAGIAVAVFVISALLTVEAGFGALVGSAQDTLLDVREKGLACMVTGRVFDSYLGSISRNHGVSSATGVLRGIYTYQSKENLVTVSGVDYDVFRDLKAIRVVKGSEQAFAARPDAALVGQPLATQYGWREGQSVSLLEDRLTFTIAGIFVSPDKAYESGVLLHKKYLARLKHDEGKSTYLLVSLKNPADVSAVSRAIDSEFANHPKPTKTQSERAARERELQEFIDIRRMFALLVLAVIVVSIFGAANSVSMSVRERTREVGILRSLGLRKEHILGILIGESVSVALVGGAIGMGLASLLLATDRTMGGMIPLSLRPSTLILAAAVSILIGLVGAVLPAVRATKLSIVDALRLAD